MLSYPLLLTVARFGTVGLVVMGFFMLLNAWLSPLIGRHPAFLLAYVPAVALHFCLNKWWTFGCERKDAARQISQYLLMVLATFVVQWAIFATLTAVTLLPSWICAGLANAGQMVLSFLIMYRKIFRSSPRDQIPAGK